MRIILIKKRSLLYFLVATILLIIVLFIWNNYRFKAVATFMPSLTRIIVLDPGHGGEDPGTVGKTGIKEKDINLIIAKHLRDYLQQSGAIVIMTRTEDKALSTGGASLKKRKNEDLRRRKEIVETSRGDIFITIHLNSFPQSQYYGAQTFYPPDNSRGKILAENIQSELINILDKNNKRVALPKSEVYLIKGLDIPTCLVECGFLSNPKEERLLGKSDYQKKIAWAIYVGIQNYFANNP